MPLSSKYLKCSSYRFTGNFTKHARLQSPFRYSNSIRLSLKIGFLHLFRKTDRGAYPFWAEIRKFSYLFRSRGKHREKTKRFSHVCATRRTTRFSVPYSSPSRHGCAVRTLIGYRRETSRVIYFFRSHSRAGIFDFGLGFGRWLRVALPRHPAAFGRP